MRRLALISAALFVSPAALADAPAGTADAENNEAAPEQPVVDGAAAPSAPPEDAARTEAPRAELFAETSPEWQHAYDAARAKLVTGEFADAAARFAELERTAESASDRALAHAQRTLAAEWAARGLAFVAQESLGETPISAKAVGKRTIDELASLYGSSVLYGIGSGIWLATLTAPRDTAGVLLPTIALTGASVGAVVALDSGRGLRYGVPQSIISGLNLGLEQGVVWSLYAGSRDADWATHTYATVIWGASTVGAVAGGVLGQAVGATPGRASWVGSSGLWTGALAGLTTHAVADGEEAAFLAAGLGLTLGTGVGLATASGVSPSIARVRFLDLGGISGGLVVGGLYAAAANRDIDSRWLAASAAVGALGGLGAAWALTSSMPEDRPRSSGEAPEGALSRLRPTVMPAAGGAMIGLGGELY